MKKTLLFTIVSFSFLLQLIGNFPDGITKFVYIPTQQPQIQNVESNK